MPLWNTTSPDILKKRPEGRETPGTKLPPSRLREVTHWVGTPDVGECDFHINTIDTKGMPLKLNNEEVLQAFTDAIGGLALALAKQIDAAKLAADLRTLANDAEKLGHGPSAGLLDEVARTVEVRMLNKEPN